MMKTMRWFAGALLAAALAACGGGGGSPGTSPGGGDNGGGNGGTGGTGGSPSMTVSVVDGSGNDVTAVNFAGTYQVRAKVLDATGAAVVGKIVSFTVGDSAIAALNPSTALTDSTGVAQVNVAPASANALGATTVGASATVGTTSVSGSKDIAVSSSGGQPNNLGPTVVVTVVTPGGAPTTSLTVGGNFLAHAVVTDGAGAPVASRLVTFSVSNAAIATLNPTTALTDASGVAQVGIAPTSITSLGAATLTASATVGTQSVQGTTDFSVSASNLSLSSITLGSNFLSSGGNTSVTVTALIGGAPASATPVNITFSASCGRINGQGTFSATTDGSGVASVAYTAVNQDGTLCSGPVTITASTAGASPQSATVNVTAPVANAITFVGADPGQIFVKGSGALEQSLVTFKVLSGNTPMTNVPVQFAIVTNPGGVGLGSTGSTAPVTVTTDSQGLASVSVFSGTIPGPVKVRASLVANSTVYAETQDLSVSSGPPSQRYMSLSAQTYNIEGDNLDGTPTTLTVRLADRQGNPVDDGTVVNFTAEGGQVASSCATQKVNGIAQCSVTFVSQNPRLDPNGRYSVLAFASGTKDYDDVNGNNIYDAGTDTLHDIGEAYRDDNEDGTYAAGEFVIPRGGSMACAGSGEPFPARANTCDNQLATTVRQQAVILFSSSGAAPLASSCTSPATLPCVKQFTDAVLDFYLGSAGNPKLPMPSGTTVAADVSGGSCAVDKVFNPTVPNVVPGTDPNETLITEHIITFKNCGTGDVAVVKVTAPGGTITNIPFTFP
jgi:hypothetical protein